MPFIWRKHSASTAPAHAQEALTGLDAAYVLVDLQSGEETFSQEFARFLESASPITDTITLMDAVKAESRPRLLQTLSALKQNQIVAPVVLLTEAGGKALLARGSIVPGASRHYGVLWLHDITSEYRNTQRLMQESEKLKSEIKHFSTILNMAPYPIWQRDGELRVRYYNLAYSEIAEESTDKSVEHAAPELDRRERTLAAQALATGEPKSERRHIVIDGQRRLIEINELPLPGEKMVIGFAHDVTELETMQEELQRYISAQSDLLESSASAMAIYGADMRLKSFNYAFAALWKLDEGWLETHPSYGEILENLREKRKLPEQANFVLFKQQQLKLFTDLIEPREEFFYLPDGRSLRVIAIPHALGGILFAYEDVTDRLALERSYNTLIAVQRETLDHLHEGVAVFGENGRLKLSNPVFLSMWNLDEAFGRTEPHIADIVDRSRHLHQYEDWESFRQERVAQVQSRAVSRRRMERADGKVIDCTTVPLPDGATLITYLDVTDSTLVERSLRERNEALQEADRLKSEFLANVSYELRSPLTSISGFSEMLRQEYFGNLTEKQKEYVEGIHSSSQHLMQLVNDILDLASIEAGYMQLEVTRFDLHAMLKSVLPLLKERIKEHDLTVKLECPTKIGKLLADETRMRQLLFKLLSNAVSFSPPGTTITFGAREQGEEQVVLFVRDQGYGISPEEQKAVFDKFYKGSGKDAPKGKKRSGAGLGLSIVKSFIELHGGAVGLASGEGGTTIECTLPRENPDLLQYVQTKPTRRRNNAQAADV